jgi:hypothetical protein
MESIRGVVERPWLRTAVLMDSRAFVLEILPGRVIGCCLDGLTGPRLEGIENKFAAFGVVRNRMSTVERKALAKSSQLDVQVD